VIALSVTFNTADSITYANLIRSLRRGDCENRVLPRRLTSACFVKRPALSILAKLSNTKHNTFRSVNALFETPKRTYEPLSPCLHKHWLLTNTKPVVDTRFRHEVSSNDATCNGSQPHDERNSGSVRRCRSHVSAAHGYIHEHFVVLFVFVAQAFNESPWLDDESNDSVLPAVTLWQLERSSQ
jgi:hypothetical protein